MARAISNATLFTALSDGIALLSRRRGFSTSAATTVTGSGRRGLTVVEMKAKREGSAAVMESSSVESSWVPDPVTGHYRPANWMVEMDPAELRAMLLKHKPRA